MRFRWMSQAGCSGQVRGLAVPPLQMLYTPRIDTRRVRVGDLSPRAMLVRLARDGERERGPLRA